MTALARPRMSGLLYFPLDVDFFEDPKIKILRARYGADGIMLYVYLLCKIYKQGYYIQVDDDFEYIISDDLKMDQNKAKQVLNFLLLRSLFDNTLFQSDKVLTSAGIQRRFQLAVKERARKNPVEVGRFWVLKKEETEPFIKCTLFNSFSEKKDSYSEKKDSYSEKNECNSTEESLKKSKENKNIDNIAFPPELERAFQMYLLVRNNYHGEAMDEEIAILREELLAISDNDAERIAIAKKAATGRWKSFYKTGKKKDPSGSEKGKMKDNNNFERRRYSAEELAQLQDN